MSHTAVGAAKVAKDIGVINPEQLMHMAVSANARIVQIEVRCRRHPG
jgi:hypothetical protein